MSFNALQKNKKIIPIHMPPKTEKLFMLPKEFAKYYGASYQKVLEWIAAGMPVIPECKNPYRIIVSAAVDWLHKRYRF